MAKQENPPFARGRTYFDGIIDALVAPNTTTADGGLQIEGKDWIFEDVNPTLLNAPVRTNHYVRCRAIRNMASFALLPGFVVQRDDTEAGLNFSRVAGYTDVTAQDALGVVDEYLSASIGCPQYDICWVVVEGPTIIMTPLDGGSDNVFAVGNRVVALTAATSGATTAGRIVAQAIAATTLQNADALEIMNVIGRAMSAATTANTNTGLLVYVGKF